LTQVMKHSEVLVAAEQALAEEHDFALAWITHYLQAIGTPAAEYFRHEAVAHLKSLPGRVEWDDVPFPPKADPAFTFIDLFAGIGGMRLAGQALGGNCVFSSEWDKYAQKTYLANFGEMPFGDIRPLAERAGERIPEHDLLFAGFPCQAFSIAGHRGGFNDTRGTLFFEVARIIKAKRPRVLILENVKGLVGHDRGRTLATILAVLREDLGYYVPEPRIVNARDHGVPQNRERIIVVGFSAESGVTSFEYPPGKRLRKRIGDIKEKSPVSAKYYLSTRYLETLRAHRARHESKGNGFGYVVHRDNDVAGAIVCGGMGRERNLIVDDRLTDFTPVTNIKGTVNREGIRRMTPREWARLQGFPESFIIDAVSDTQAFKQFGNSVATPAIRAVAESALRTAGIL